MKPMIVFTLLALAPMAAQEINFEKLRQLAAKAANTVDVNLDASMLTLGSKFLSPKDPDQAKIKELVKELKGLYVRVYEFGQEGAYSDSDLEEIRSQLKQAAGWARIASVRESKGRETVEVYLKKEGDRIGGLTVIAAEPKELTIAHILGPVDPEKLGELGGFMGMPKVDSKIRYGKTVPSSK
jgi:hypothetical protein